MFAIIYIAKPMLCQSSQCYHCFFFLIFRRKSKIREKVPQYDDPGFDYPNGDACKKSPLYDELSIPFIDASPAPTPKAGRSTER